MMLNRTISSVEEVKISKHLTEQFHTRRGFKQNDCLLCALLNIMLEKVIRAANLNRSSTVYPKSTMLLGYADAYAIIRRLRIGVNNSAVRPAFSSLEKQAQEVGLVVSEGRQSSWRPHTGSTTSILKAINLKK